MLRKSAFIYLLIGLLVCLSANTYSPFKHSGPFLDLANSRDCDEVRAEGDLIIIKRDVEEHLFAATYFKEGNMITHFPRIKIDDTVYQLRFENKVLTGYIRQKDLALSQGAFETNRNMIEYLFEEYERQVDARLGSQST